MRAAMCNSGEVLLDFWSLKVDVKGFHFQGDYQLAIATEGMIHNIVVHLSSDNFDLKMQCSSAIFKCASDKVSH
jgi:hypothetical protein